MKMKKAVVMLLAGNLLTAGTASADVEPPKDLSMEAGNQLARDLDELQREEIWMQIEEDQEINRQKEKEAEQVANKAGSEDGLTFKVTSIQVDKSDLLTYEEINNVTKDYVGDNVSLFALNELTNKINDLYNQKGYITCRAYVPEQTISDGVVRIALFEGRVGDVTVVGNKTTDKDYIVGRLDLENGTHSNVNELNSDIQWFNATNDAKLKISMVAGKEPGTTDYVVTVVEPKKYEFNVFADNAGNSSSGEYRAGVYFTDKSLTKERDSFTVGYVGSQGTKAFSALYNRYVGRSGAKLKFSYSTNSIKIVEHPTNSLDITGHANAYSIGYVQPLIVNYTTRAEAGLDINIQNSKTAILKGTTPWVDDTFREATASYSLTNYGRSHVFFQKHSYTVGHRIGLTSELDKNYNMYKLLALYRKSFKNGSQINATLSGQLSGIHYIPSSRAFYIGGSSSVRGYKESLLSGDNGYSLNLEYQYPIYTTGTTTTNAIAFFDYGNVWGDGTFDDHVLSSWGVGFKSNFDKNHYFSLVAAFPLRKNVNVNEIDDVRFHATLSLTF